MTINHINDYLKRHHLILDDSVHNVTGTYYLRDIDFKPCSELQDSWDREKYSLCFYEDEGLPFDTFDEIWDEIVRAKRKQRRDKCIEDSKYLPKLEEVQDVDN